MRTKKYLNLSIDAELLDRVRPYINNLSSFMEQCLINYVQKNKELIQSDDFRTAKYLLKPLTENDLPNITYIINEQKPVQLKLFDIVDNRIVSPRKEKVLTYPTSEDFFFTSNVTCCYKKKTYYFEEIKFKEKKLSLEQKLDLEAKELKEEQQNRKKERIEEIDDNWWENY